MAEGGHRCVYVPRERRATPFRGDGSDLIDAEEWSSDITRFATARGMTGLDGAEYALANLEGLARREILSLPASDINTAKEICDAIITAFGERRSAAQLRDALHARRQANTETVREFGHSLFRILERLQSKLHDTPAMLKCDFNARFVEGLRNKAIRKNMRAFLSDADRTDDDFKIVRDKAVQFEREEEEDEDDAEEKQVASCQQSSVTDLQQQITTLVDTVAQLSVNMATLTDRVNERMPTDQNSGGSQYQFDRAYEQRGDDRQRSARYVQQRRPRRQANSRDRCHGCGNFGHFRRECTQHEPSLNQPMTNRYSGNDRPPL